MIKFEFIRGYDLSKIEIIELDSYREFVLFYINNYDKGYIGNVRLNEEVTK